MPETNATEQALRDQLAETRTQLAKANEAIDGLKKQDTEATIANLRKDVADRDTTIKEKDQTIANLTTQLDAAKEANKGLVTRAETAEASLKTANDELSNVRAAEQKRGRLATLTEKGAEAAIASQLVDKFASLDDKAFEETVALLAPTWKKSEPPAPPKRSGDPATAAIQKAKVEEEPALNTEDDEVEGSRAAITNFIGKSLSSARGNKAPAKSE